MAPWQRVTNEKDAHLKTIHRWNWGNVSNIASRLESEEAERVRKEEEERLYWMNRKRQAAENWARIQAKQKGHVLAVHDKVVVRGSTKHPALQMGVISKVHADGTYAIEYMAASAGPEVAVVRENILLAPPPSEPLFLGARVGVKFPNNEDLFMGVVTSINKDGTYAVQYDGGHTHASIVREAITLFHNEPLYEGARVEHAAVEEGSTADGHEGPRRGIITRANDDGSYDVIFEGGEVVASVARVCLALDHSLPVEVGARVGVKFPNKPKPYMGVVTKLNEDGTFAVRYDGGTALHASIARHMITVHPADTLSPGDHVNYKEKGNVLAGHIQSFEPEGTYAIRAADGTEVKGVSYERISRFAPPESVASPSAQSPKGASSGSPDNALGRRGLPQTLRGTSIVSDQLRRIREEEAARMREENEKRRWLEERRRKQPRNWAAWFEKQKQMDIGVGQAVVVRGESLDQPLRTGVVRKVAGSVYTIECGDGQQVAVSRAYLLIAPASSAAIYDGARVGVHAGPNGPIDHMGVVTNIEGSKYVVKTDDGPVVEVPRDLLTLFYNDALSVGDAVTVRHTKGKVYSGVIKAVNDDGTYGVLFDSGMSSRSVPRPFISLAAHDVSIMAGDLVNFDGAQVGRVREGESSLQTAVVVSANPDQSFVVSIRNPDDTESLQTIRRHDIKAYYDGARFVSAPQQSVLADPASRGTIHLDSTDQAAASVAVLVEHNSPVQGLEIKRRNANPPASKANALDFSSTLRMMSAGAEFDWFLPDRKRRVFMFYLRPQEGGEGQSGSVHWCDPGQKIKVPGQMVNLRSISDIFMGKKAGVFESAAKSQANSKNCFSIILKEDPTPFNFAGDSQETRTQWINGFNTVITAMGRKVQVAYNHGYRPANTGATLQRFPTLRPHQTLTQHRPKVYGSDMATKEVQKMRATLMRHATLATYSADDMIEMMAGGSDFVAYSLTDDGGVLSQDIFLFYVAGIGPGGVGTLYWCAPDNRVASTENSLPLAHIRELHLGKQSDVLQHPDLDPVAWNKCLSIYSYDGTHDLHIEAAIPKQVSAWLEGVNAILA